MILIIDNGHGSNTPGKRSPDGTLLEYKWAREVAQIIADKASAIGITQVILVPEQNDIPLNTRTKRANDICKKHGTKNCILISVHINAAGADGKWHTASGWSGWVSPNASANSKRLARLLWEEANNKGLRGNRSVPSEKYWVGNWAMCRDTLCPAVLTENLFQDNKQECEYLLTQEAKNTIADVHIAAIKKYLNL